jgi:glutathione S-transferase
LDQYKYPNRYPELKQEDVLQQAFELMLKPMEIALQNHQHFMGEKPSWVDIAIFPFIRQFAMVHPEKFATLAIPRTQEWLNQHLESALFQSIMEKHPTWTD